MRVHANVHANVNTITDANCCADDVHRVVCYSYKSSANHGGAGTYCNSLDAKRFTANHCTADTHCAACYSYKSTASYDGAADGRC